MSPFQHQIYRKQFLFLTGFVKIFLHTFLQAIHVELSKLVKRQSGGNDTLEWKAKPAKMLGDNVAPFLIPSKKKTPVSRDLNMYIGFILTTNRLDFHYLCCCVSGNFLEVHSRCSGCGLGQLSNLSDSDCKKLKSSAGGTVLLLLIKMCRCRVCSSALVI